MSYNLPDKLGVATVAAVAGKQSGYSNKKPLNFFRGLLRVSGVLLDKIKNQFTVTIRDSVTYTNFITSPRSDKV